MEESKQKILNSAIILIEKYCNQLEKLTMREIAKEANVAVGLVNYHFRSKDLLIEVCVEKIVNGVVLKFQSMIAALADIDAMEKLERLSLFTLNYLFENATFAKISILSDFKKNNHADNTFGTYQAYLPLVKACRGELNDMELKRLNFRLISVMQTVFLRADIIKNEFGYDLYLESERNQFHSIMLKEIIYGRE